ncbi:hypothetical protein CC2G_006264 [Coprinopsis cinerea AmutBmut pab1-1]|nr:hypothetical protein CC2G_006264 [Coprinopsis cinerea AmutBmut pab1-1]
MTRRTRFVLLSALVIFILFVVVPHLRRGSTGTTTWNNAGGFENKDELSGAAGTLQDDERGIRITNTNNSPNVTSDGLCTEESCFRGAWKPRRPPLAKIDEVEPWKGCPSSLRGATKEEERKASERRLLDVLNWVWVPDEGTLADWDPEAFVVRLLKSPGGLVSVGDDISKRHFEALIVLLKRSVALELFTSDQQSFRRKHVTQYILAPNDPGTQRIYERAGVPDSRINRPILTMIEDSLLVSDTDLLTIVQRLGGVNGNQRWSPRLPRVDRWPVLVEDLAAPVDDERESVTADTILLLNTGIHWSREHLTLLKPRANPLAEQNYLTEAYRQMLRTVSESLKPISNLSIYYRATTPGHPRCHTRTSPYKSAKLAETMEKNVVGRLLQGVLDEGERQKRRKWDWDLFVVHNDLWRRAIVRLEQERKQMEEKPYPFTKYYAKWRYLDVWSQALQRPDAHYDPTQDCLSWCSPVLFDQWTRHLQHVLNLEKPEFASKKDMPSEEDDIV